MALSLSPTVQQLIDDRVKSGRYASAEEVIIAALTQLDSHEELASLSPAELEAIYPSLREKIEQGWADAEAGRVSDGDAFFDEIEREEAAADADSGAGRKSA